ncbi:MAG: DUF418 domain-containing protein [Novosphingobium sp.]
MLWFGEILFNYAICGMLLFALRKLPVKTHLIMAAVLLIGASALSYGYAQSAVATEAAATAASQAQSSGAKLSAEQQKAIEAWQEEVSHISPTAQEIAEQRGWHTGSYWNAVKGQLGMSYEFQWTGAPRWLLFDMIPFMLIGMALLKLGVLGAQRSNKTYLLMMLGGYAIGLGLGWRELHLILDSNFARLGFAAAGETYQFSRLAMVIGHLGLLLLIIRSGVFGALQRAMGAVGQMALTNYLMQTVICTLLFYGFGFGLWGQLERYQLYGVVAAIWLAELIWSPLWLARFRFGPFEWAWRSLTYWERQPMRL